MRNPIVADAQGHGESPFRGEVGTSSLPEPGVKGAEEDVRHVERAEWTFLEDRLEFLAVALSPAGGVAADEQ